VTAAGNWINWATFWPSFLVALIGTCKVFAIGSAGFYLVRRGHISDVGLQTMGLLISYLTLPCLIFYRMATRFDPRTFPDWWKFVLIGGAITLFGLAMGKLVALRHGNNDEATMLVGFQNSGFFVLPMLEALLPAHEYTRASLLLFMLVAPFNASLWTAGSWLLLGRREFNYKLLLTPPFVATVSSLLIYSLFHDAVRSYDETIFVRILFGDEGGATGAVQQIGDLTIPLSTLTLGGAIAANITGKIKYRRAVAETTLMRLVGVPLCGLVLLQFWPGPQDYVVGLLIMLQFAAPPATALSVFAQQYRMRMTLIPAVCLLAYILCLITVPFFVALVPR
jgi:predicted permease